MDIRQIGLIGQIRPMINQSDQTDPTDPIELTPTVIVWVGLGCWGGMIRKVAPKVLQA